MPSQRMIRTQNSDPTLHILKVPFSIPFDTVVDDLTVRVILPEGMSIFIADFCVKYIFLVRRR